MSLVAPQASADLPRDNENGDAWLDTLSILHSSGVAWWPLEAPFRRVEKVSEAFPSRRYADPR